MIFFRFLTEPHKMWNTKSQSERYSSITEWYGLDTRKLKTETVRNRIMHLCLHNCSRTSIHLKNVARNAIKPLELAIL